METVAAPKKRRYLRKLKTPEQKKAETLAKVRELTEKGVNQTDIMSVMKLSRESVRLYQREVEAASQPITTFKEKLSDALHLDLLIGTQLKHKLLISLAGDDISTLGVAEKRQLINTLATSNGITYDKIRLQDGKSTVNSSHRVQLESTHASLDVVWSGQATKGKTCSITGQEWENGAKP